MLIKTMVTGLALAAAVAPGLVVTASAAPVSGPAADASAADQDGRLAGKVELAKREGAVVRTLWYCGQTAPDKDGRSWPRYKGNYINIRSGPSTSCRSKGQGQSYQRSDYHCYVYISSRDETWTYQRNNSTNVYGWVSDDLLADNGSNEPC
jgi:hypothetical protein